MDYTIAKNLLERLTGFWNEVEDPVANVTIGAGPGNIAPCGFVPAGGVCRQRQNSGWTQIRGVEAELDTARSFPGPWREVISLTIQKS